MASITLTNIPAALLCELRKRADLHHRSLNGEILATLKTATGKTHRVNLEAMIREARAARAKFRRAITAREIDRWKRQGRL